MAMMNVNLRSLNVWNGVVLAGHHGSLAGAFVFSVFEFEDIIRVRYNNMTS